MRLLRMTTRVWMIAVAVVGIMLAGVEGLLRQSHVYRERAYDHALMETTDGGRYWSLYAGISWDDEDCIFKRPAESDGLLSPTARQLYHHRMYHKWLRAASRPWLLIEPDPPEPD
jgi:hypothetical protein